MSTKSKKEHTHRELCDIAVRWLKRSLSSGGPGCQFSVSEVQSGWDGEIVDAIGFRFCAFTSFESDGSYLVEVKTSRSDFLADAKKPHRMNPETGMGKWRFYMCPEGLIKPDELPPKWGLLYVNARGHVSHEVSPIAPKYYEQPVRWNDPSQGTVTKKHFVICDKWMNENFFPEYNHIREMTLMARLLTRVGDPEKLNNRVKELSRMNSNLAKQCEDYRKHLEESSRDLSQCYRDVRQLETANSILESARNFPIGGR